MSTCYFLYLLHLTLVTSYTCYFLYLLHLKLVTSYKCYFLHVLLLILVTSYTCYFLHLLRLILVTSYTCYFLHLILLTLVTSHILTSYTCYFLHSFKILLNNSYFYASNFLCFLLITFYIPYFLLLTCCRECQIYSWIYRKYSGIILFKLENKSLILLVLILNIFEYIYSTKSLEWHYFLYGNGLIGNFIIFNVKRSL